MLKNHLKIAWRSLRKNKLFSLVNLSSLTLGITCFILLALYVVHELRYDRFHEKADRIVRIITDRQYGEGGIQTSAVTPTALVPDFGRHFPEIESGVRIYEKKETVRNQERVFNEDSFLYADSSFFELFSFEIAEGNPATMLNAPNSVVLTRESAEKYFGEEDPIGKGLLIGQSRRFTVTGIVEKIPDNSSIKFDLLASFSSLEVSKEEVWCCANYHSYLLLKASSSVASLQQKMDERTHQLLRDWDEKPGSVRYQAEPLARMHLYSKVESAGSGGNINYIYLLGIIAIIQLLIACINFMNLSAARGIERLREIGVRKALGAPQQQLFKQFIAEPALVTFISLVISLLVVSAIMPLFNHLTERTLQISSLFSPWGILSLLSLFFLVTLLAGAYPSLVSSTLQPVKALAGKKAIVRSGKDSLGRGLLIFQFAVSAFFITGTIIVNEQLNYIQHKNLGLVRDQVVVIDESPGDKLNAIKNALSQQPGIQDISASYHSPVHIRGGYSIFEAEGKGPDFEMNVTAIPAEKDFVKTLGMELIAGRDIRESDVRLANPVNDDNPYHHFIINQSTAKALGWTPEKAIGKRINLNGRLGAIGAVVKDFHFASMHNEIGPLVIFPEYNYFGNMLIKVSGNNIETTLDHIQTTWQSFFTEKPFEYHFLDDDFDQLYRSEIKLKNILNLFATMAIFVACLGLFGLAAYATLQRTKEIGIRKTLGASVTGIIVLLSRDFIRLVLIALVIALPPAWLAMHYWLQDFAYRIELSWWLFAFAALLIMLIALLTMSFQSVKAALSNPVKALRSE